MFIDSLISQKPCVPLASRVDLFLDRVVKKISSRQNSGKLSVYYKKVGPSKLKIPLILYNPLQHHLSLFVLPCDY